MSPAPQLLAEFSALLVKAFEGDAAPEEIRRINEIFATQPGAYEYYFDFLNVAIALNEVNAAACPEHASCHYFWSELLIYEQIAPTIEAEPDSTQPKPLPPTTATPRQPRKISPLPRIAAMLSTAALFIVLLALWFMKPQQPVAFLQDSVNAQWADSSQTHAFGDCIYAGPLKLNQGFAEIVLRTGVHVVLEAPVSLRLESSSRLYLERGQLTANMNDSSTSFTVRTANAVIVDLGTEFAVKVDASGETQTHVFNGAVEVRSHGDSASAAKKLNLATGQCARVDRSGAITRAHYQPHLFTRQEQFNDHFRAAQGSPLHRWKAYNESLHRDPALITHFTFEHDPVRPNLLLNSAPNAFALDGILGQGGQPPTWTQGRWPGKTALAFNRENNEHVVVPADQTFTIRGPITISVWLRIDDPLTGGHILACRTYEDRNYQIAWFCGTENAPFQNRMQYSRHSDDAALYSDVIAPPVPGKWRLFSVTHDNQVASFYLDGRLVSSHPYVSQDNPVFADLVIGDIIERESPTHFNGIIDEVVILNRVMKPAEILAMYQAGLP